MIKFRDVEPGVRPDFHVEDMQDRNVTYYTPMNLEAQEWADKNLAEVPQHGRSYMFKFDSERASKLRGYLKREGFVVSR